MKLLFTLISLIWLTGCVGMPPKYDPIELMTNNDLQSTEKVVSAIYPKTSKNRLLYFLELGMLAHIQQQYEQSNKYLNTADELVEELYTQSITEIAGALFTGANAKTYRGYTFEKSYINYYKALNYLALSKNKQLDHTEQLDAAIIEVKRLGLKQTLVTQAGEEDELNKSSVTYKITNFLKRIIGAENKHDFSRLKNDAFSHYLAGLLYEMANYPDSARIEYEKAAKRYEQNQQSSSPNSALVNDKKMSEEVWFDVAKLLKTNNGNENDWQFVAQKKLSREQYSHLQQLKPQQSELVILQDLGVVPKRETINMDLRLDEHARSLVLTPYLSGTLQERQHKNQWFQLLYADNDISSIIENYAFGGPVASLSGTFTKRIPLYGKMWQKAVDLDLTAALSQPIRVAVPYYPPIKTEFEKTEIYINGEYKGLLTTTHSIGQLALEEQLNNAHSDILLALTQELVKAISAYQLTKNMDNDLKMFAQIGLSLVNMVTGSADTRNWLSLPAQTKYARIPIESGEHDIVLKTYLHNKQVIEQHSKVNVLKNQTNLWHTRTYAKQLLNSKNDVL